MNNHASWYYVGDPQDENPLSYAQNYLDNRGIRPKYGDLIVFPDAGYRNSGLAIYDGDRVINLDTSIWEYGNLPPKFTVLQPNYFANGTITKSFHKRYWHDENQRHFIDGHINWFDHLRYGDQSIKNITRGNICNLDNVVYTYVTNEEGMDIYLIFTDEVDNAEKLFRQHLLNNPVVASGSRFPRQLSRN